MKHGKPKQRKEFAAVSLSKFGGIGKSTYDKREKKEKERKHNAARVNAYRKLQKRLGDKLEPKFRLEVRRMSMLLARRRSAAAALHGAFHNFPT